jgi:tocopherol cyclase
MMGLPALLARPLAAYRATGADPPLGDPARAHGVALEGYFWRIVHPRSGVVAVALGAACRDADGGTWGLATLAAHPGGFARSALTRGATAAADGFGLRAEDALSGDAAGVRVDLGPDALLDVTLHDHVLWPRRGGALGAAHAIPALPHYWHPVVLSARVRGRLRAGGLEQDLDGAVAYAEKNWGGAFPGRWWWGHAAAFEDPGVSVSFAGGHVPLLGGSVAPTAVVVRIGRRVLALAPPPARTRVALGEDSWRLRTRAPALTVELSGAGAGVPPHELLVPLPGAGLAEERSRQHLAARLELRVRRGRRLLIDDASPLAGLELGDPL